jgi:AhpD family alkylhydroperoxidase
LVQRLCVVLPKVGNRQIDEQLAANDNWIEHSPARPARRGTGHHESLRGMAQAATASKALDAKTKELIALGIAVAVRCDDCIAFHAKAAVEQGATRDEVSETLGMAIYMGAGPSVMYASHAFEAFTQFKALKPTDEEKRIAIY